MPDDHGDLPNRNCGQCSRQAITYIRYSGSSLCEEHFEEFLVARVKREMRKQGKLPPDSTIAVAVSGGKDSLSLLQLLAELFEKHRDIRLVAVSVDEGISPYRTESLEKASRFCAKLGIEQRIMSFKDRFGYSLDEIVSAGIPELLPCSFCGVFRRVCLNTMARELSATKLATGHNLDDSAQSILMNICKGDFNKLFRLGPHRTVKQDLVPRIMPLRIIPEKEIYLHSMLNKLDPYTGECPYATLAQRGLYRNILYQLEQKHPGTRHAIINIYDQLYDNMGMNTSAGSMEKCSSCGEPSTGILCKSCQMLNMVRSYLG